MMMRNAPDRLSSCTSLFLSWTALFACFVIVMFSWPEPREHRRAALNVATPCCDVVIGVPVVDGVDVVPVAAQTASIAKPPGAQR
jgi:hypothetical protein